MTTGVICYNVCQITPPTSVSQCVWHACGCPVFCHPRSNLLVHCLYKYYTMRDLRACALHSCYSVTDIKDRDYAHFTLCVTSTYITFNYIALFVTFWTPFYKYVVMCLTYGSGSYAHVLLCEICLIVCALIQHCTWHANSHHTPCHTVRDMRACALY